MSRSSFTVRANAIRTTSTVVAVPLAMFSAAPGASEIS